MQTEPAAPSGIPEAPEPDLAYIVTRLDRIERSVSSTAVHVHALSASALAVRQRLDAAGMRARTIRAHAAHYATRRELHTAAAVLVLVAVARRLDR